MKLESPMTAGSRRHQASTPAAGVGGACARALATAAAVTATRGKPTAPSDGAARAPPKGAAERLKPSPSVTTAAAASKQTRERHRLQEHLEDAVVSEVTSGGDLAARRSRVARDGEPPQAKTPAQLPALLAVRECERELRPPPPPPQKKKTLHCHVEDGKIRCKYCGVGKRGAVARGLDRLNWQCHECRLQPSDDENGEEEGECADEEAAADVSDAELTAFEAAVANGAHEGGPFALTTPLARSVPLTAALAPPPGLPPPSAPPSPAGSELNAYDDYEEMADDFDAAAASHSQPGRATKALLLLLVRSPLGDGSAQPNPSLVAALTPALPEPSLLLTPRHAPWAPRGGRQPPKSPAAIVPLMAPISAIAISPRDPQLLLHEPTRTAPKKRLYEPVVPPSPAPTPLPLAAHSVAMGAAAPMNAATVEASAWSMPSPLAYRRSGAVSPLPPQHTPLAELDRFASLPLEQQEEHRLNPWLASPSPYRVSNPPPPTPIGYAGPPLGPPPVSCPPSPGADEVSDEEMDVEGLAASGRSWFDERVNASYYSDSYLRAALADPSAGGDWFDERTCPSLYPSGYLRAALAGHAGSSAPQARPTPPCARPPPSPLPSPPGLGSGLTGFGGGGFEGDGGGGGLGANDEAIWATLEESQLDSDELLPPRLSRQSAFAILPIGSGDGGGGARYVDAGGGVIGPEEEAVPSGGVGAAFDTEGEALCPMAAVDAPAVAPKADAATPAAQGRCASLRHRG